MLGFLWCEGQGVGWDCNVPVAVNAQPSAQPTEPLATSAPTLGIGQPIDSRSTLKSPDAGWAGPGPRSRQTGFEHRMARTKRILKRRRGEATSNESYA